MTSRLNFSKNFDGLLEEMLGQKEVQNYSLDRIGLGQYWGGNSKTVEKPGWRAW